MVCFLFASIFGYPFGPHFYRFWLILASLSGSLFGDFSSFLHALFPSMFFNCFVDAISWLDFSVSIFEWPIEPLKQIRAPVYNRGAFSHEITFSRKSWKSTCNFRTDVGTHFRMFFRMTFSHVLLGIDFWDRFSEVVFLSVFGPKWSQQISAGPTS